jgi:LmbE family N-acetylglucosaminyl deacetylase
MINTVAVIAAHPDDEVLGCGGAIARMVKEGRSVHILLMADGESSRDGAEISKPFISRVTSRNNAAERACNILGCTSVTLLSLPDNRLDHIDLLDVVKLIEDFIQKYKPVTILTHHSGDVNIDHRIVHEAVVVASRPQPGFFVKELLFFEVPSSTEWRPLGSSEMFNPNCFYDISDTLDIKLNALQAYQEELREFPHPRSTKAIEALARWRGACAGFEAAEAFILGRKLV